ncbi:MAG: rod-binding protein [Candidatus Poribacteria bacterium]|nr:rod-binding protein [Candidatus Poribacteria bacterium]
MKIPMNATKAAFLQSNSRMKKLSQTAEKMGRNSGSDTELRKATQEFESLFLHYLMKSMRSTVPKNDLFHGGQAEEIFTDMLDQAIAETASKRGIGIADLLYQQLRSVSK